MSAQRVVVLHSHSLYAELVANLLRAETNAKVVEIVSSADDLISQVSQLDPQSIIVDSQDSGLEVDTLLPPLLDRCPNARGLCLTMGEPCAEVCPARCMRVNTKSELVAALRSLNEDTPLNQSAQRPQDRQPESSMR